MVDDRPGTASPLPAGVRVLVVDDEPDVLLGLGKLVESTGAEARAAGSGEEALALLEGWPPHLVLSDISMDGMSGMELLDEIARRLPATRVVLITGFGTIELAVTAMHHGAAHFITKPFDNEEIVSAVRRFGVEAFVDERIQRGREAEEGSDGKTLLGSHPAMQAVMALIDQVGPTPVSGLVEGESGTGKELVARTIHERSPRRDRPFLAVNTAALPDPLLESELFGHVRGAFSGASRERSGIFQQVDGGTVMLDEIGLMSPAFQGKLLRVLQERRVVPLGTTQSVAVDFRLVAAAGGSLTHRMREGAFREDLYYRLRVVTIRLPPLRDRASDIPLLASHFLRKYADHVPALHGTAPALSTAALAELTSHRWPGNVRELENCIQRALVLSGGGTIRAQHLGLCEDDDPLSLPRGDGLSYEEGKQRAVESFQRRYIENVLRRAEGNVSRAARICGLTRAALQRIMRSLSMERARFVPGADEGGERGRGA
ncbi:MAG: sigma-54-dependent transcriptional regulator [Planctomycetota bacterium]